MHKKLEVLKVLKKNKNKYVQTNLFLSDYLTNREDLEKSIDYWREQGYKIVESGEFGLMLTELPDRLYPWELQAGLPTQTMGKEIFYHDETDSTNREALDKAKKGTPEGTVIVAEYQSKGRGRFQRMWESPKYKGVYISFVLRPRIHMRMVPQLTLLTGVAVAQAVREGFGCEALLKWPNDVLVKGKKICGILAEARSDKNKEYPEYVVIGVGLNANFAPGEFPPEIEETGTSVFIETGKKISRVELVQRILTSFEGHYERFLREGYPYLKQVWLANNCTIGREVSIKSSHVADTVTGVAVDLGEHGGIVLKKKDSGEIREYLAGDVSIGTENFS